VLHSEGGDVDCYFHQPNQDGYRTRLASYSKGIIGSFTRRKHGSSIKMIRDSKIQNVFPVSFNCMVIGPRLKGNVTF